MKDFIYLFSGGNVINPADSPTAAQEQMDRWTKWGQLLHAQGKYVGGDRLKKEIKTLKSSTLVTDGPFAEGKEVVGGYMIVKANDLQEAAEMAKECPIYLFGGTVEVREIEKMEM